LDWATVGNPLLQIIHRKTGKRGEDAVMMGRKCRGVGGGEDRKKMD